MDYTNWHIISRPLNKKAEYKARYEKNKHKYQIREIILNNRWGYEYRKVRTIHI